MRLRFHFQVLQKPLSLLIIATTRYMWYQFGSWIWHTLPTQIVHRYLFERTLKFIYSFSLFVWLYVLDLGRKKKQKMSTFQPRLANAICANVVFVLMIFLWFNLYTVIPFFSYLCTGFWCCRQLRQNLAKTAANCTRIFNI